MGVRSQQAKADSLSSLPVVMVSPNNMWTLGVRIHIRCENTWSEKCVIRGWGGKFDWQLFLFVFYFAPSAGFLHSHPTSFQLMSIQHPSHLPSESHFQLPSCFFFSHYMTHLRWVMQQQGPFWICIIIGFSSWAPPKTFTPMKKEEISSTNVGTILINFCMTKQKHGKLLFFSGIECLGVQFSLSFSHNQTSNFLWWIFAIFWKIKFEN
jgi:hypothetical protein